MLQQIQHFAQLESQLQSELTQVEMAAAMHSPASANTAERDHLIRLQALTSYEAESALIDAEYARAQKRAKLLHNAIHQK